MSTHATLTVLDKLLKNRYAPRIHKQFVTETAVASRLKKKSDPEDFSSRKCIIAAHYGRSEGVGARTEGATLPRALANKFENMETQVAYLYGRIKLSRPLIKATRDNAGAFARAMQVEVEGIKESLLFDGARQMVWGDGTGRIASVSTGATSTSQVVDDVTHLRVGMYVDFYSSDGATKRNTAGERGGVQITAINTTTKTLTLSASVATTTGDYVYREDSKGAEMMGLHGIIDDGTVSATFQGLTRSSNTWLKSNLKGNSGANRALSLDLVDSAFFAGQIAGGYGFPTAIYSRPQYAIKYAQLLQTDRRFSAPVLTLDGGFKAVQYTGPGGTAPWIMDPFVRNNRIYMPHEPDLARWEMTPVEFIDEDGSMWQRALDGTDAFEAVLATYQQVGAHRCNRSTLLADITDPA